MVSRLLVMVGPPCSGKSTIGKKLASNLKYKYISSGDIARELANEDQLAELNKGKMFDEDEMRGAIKKELSDDTFFGLGVVLDGFPRNGDQLNWLRKEFPDIDPIFVMVDAPIGVIIERASRRGRSDDGSIMDRYTKYQYNTAGMISDIIESKDLHSIIVENDEV